MVNPGARLALAGLLVAFDLAAAPTAQAQDEFKSVAAAVRFEAADSLPSTPFYDAPAALGATRPGALLRKEPFDGYALPPGARAVRILYHSTDAGGHDVATSGVVLIPAGAPPAGGWPIIAWAHGTSGVARRCAPSLMKDVYYGEEGLMPMVRAGYAVVATDYYGLGAGGPHQYINKLSQAHDVIYSVPAARAAVSELGRRWVVDGHSQGGTAAWAVAELERTRADPGYLGAVAVAPGVQLRTSLTKVSGAAGNGFYLDYIAWGIHARTPTFQPSDMLTGAALERYGDLTSKGCFYYGYASFLGDPRPPVLKPGWNLTPAAQRFFRESEVGRSPIAGHLLVIAGESDKTVSIDGVRATVKQACALAVPLSFRTYPGLDHDPTMEKSTPDQLAWIADRFSGAPATNACPLVGR